MIPLCRKQTGRMIRNSCATNDLLQIASTNLFLKTSSPSKMVFAHTSGSIYNWQTHDSLTYQMIARFKNHKPCHLVVVLWHFLYFYGINIYLWQFWGSSECMKIYMLPAKVYRYTWNMLSPSLKFLKPLPCTNKPCGSRFVSHTMLLPLICLK